MSKNRNKKAFQFGIYSFFENLGFLLLELLPRCLRNLVFKVMFKKFGKRNMIDYCTYFRFPWKIRIGSGVSINRGSRFYASYHVKDAEIVIGDNVAIGPEVSVFSAGHDYSELHLPDIGASVKIHNYVWIGGRSIILPGVEIGEGSVVGAGSVVTKDIPPYSVVVGNPAKVIKKRIFKIKND